MSSTFRARSISVVVGTLATLGGLSRGLSAQGRWTVEANSSLAWWQIDPHLNHLWATTCPADPSWRPGESRSSGWSPNPALAAPATGYTNVSDTVHVPLYPRHRIRHLCLDAIRGEFAVADTIHWTGVRGTLTVQSDQLASGEAWRDETMHRVLDAAQYPQISFSIDSLVGVSMRGDTLVGDAIGTMTLRAITTPMTAAVRTVPDSGGRRVFVKWHVPAAALNTLTPSLRTVSLGLDTRLWKELFMGADLVLRPETGN